MARSSPLGVLLMAYGSPSSLDEVEDYFTHIRGGQKPTSAEVADLVERYRAIGGRSPLLERTRRVAQALREQLQRQALPSSVEVGMRHSKPFIGEAVERLVQADCSRIIGIPLAPHYSAISTGAYERAFRQACAAIRPLATPVFVPGWHEQPLFRQAWVNLLRQALDQAPASTASDVGVLFTAHSLPVASVPAGDPYPQQLRDTAAAIAEGAGVRHWQLAYQSAGLRKVEWLGPSAMETLAQLATHDGRQVILAPIGFVSEHLEILYDLDLELQEAAKRLHVVLRRTAMPDESALFVDALAAIVMAHASSPEVG